jgi:hypothetical protein
MCNASSAATLQNQDLKFNSGIEDLSGLTGRTLDFQGAIDVGESVMILGAYSTYASSIFKGTKTLKG